jgi:hypothetical protein
MITIKLNEAQRRNLVAFLRRVPLKGEEAQALVEILSQITSARPEQPGKPSSEDQHS